LDQFVGAFEWLKFFLDRGGSEDALNLFRNFTGGEPFWRMTDTYRVQPGSR
jgi:hypothetical protein